MSDFVTVNLDTIPDLLKSESPVLLTIGAPWCIDCRRAQPFLMALAKQYSDRMVFAGANVDECPGIRETYDVKHIPTMIIFKGGKPQENRLVEVKTPGELKAFIEEGLKD